MDGLSDMIVDSAGLHFTPAVGHGEPAVTSYPAVKLAVTRPAAKQDLMLRAPNKPDAPFVLNGNHGLSAIVNPVKSKVTWTSGTGAVRSAALPEGQGTVLHAGSAVTVTAHAEVPAAVLDGTGRLWFIEVWQGKAKLMMAN